MSRSQRRLSARALGALLATAVAVVVTVVAVATVTATASDQRHRQPASRLKHVVAIDPPLHAASETVQAQAMGRALMQNAERNGVWDAIASCETQGDWSAQGGIYSGGLGIANQAWDEWGGREFAPLASQATREQQIVVAERIRADKGFAAWGCGKRLGLT